MPLHRPAYRVTFTRPEDAEPVELEVVVEYADQLRAELEAAKQGLPTIKDAPQNNVAVWVWCALVRLGEYAGNARSFRTGDLLDLEAVEDEDDTVPPTPPAASSAPA